MKLSIFLRALWDTTWKTQIKKLMSCRLVFFVFFLYNDNDNIHKSKINCWSDVLFMLLVSNMMSLVRDRNCLPFRSTCVHHRFLVGSVLLIILAFCVVFCWSSSCVLCAPCYQCISIVHSWLYILFSLTFIEHIKHINMPQYLLTNSYWKSCIEYCLQARQTSHN